MDLKLNQPKPAAGTKFQERELQLRLQNPKTKDNYDKYNAWKKNKGEIDFLPIRMDIETVSRCNYACLLCTVSDWENGKRAEDMDPMKLISIMDKTDSLVEVKLTGLGEPLLQGDDFFEIVKYFRQKHVWVRAVSNASLFHVNQNISKLIDCDINDLTISIDGASAEVFESIRRKSSFKLVKENVRSLHDGLEVAKKSITKAWCCVQEKNVHQLEEIITLCAELGFPELTLSLALHGWGRDDLLSKNKKRTEQNPCLVSNERLESLNTLAKQNSIRLSIWNVSSKYSSDSFDKLCPWPFERTVLTSDFRIVPCCMIGNPDTYEIKTKISPLESFAEAWKDQAYEKFRDSHLCGKIESVCKNCYLNV